MKGKYEIIFIDEAGFNLDKQANHYAWAEKGETPFKEVPIKIQNTTFMAAISKSGVLAYQFFDRGAKG